MSPEIATLLDWGNSGLIIAAVVYLLREFGKRDDLWRGFIREHREEMSRAIEQNTAVLAEMSRQVERVTTVMLLSTPESDAERAQMIERIFGR